MREFAPRLYAVLLGLGVAMPLPALARDPGMDIPAVVKPVLPGVVNISVWGPSDADTPRNAAGVRPDRAHFFGSGFIIDPSGIIATNKHVVANAFQITVHFADGSRARAHVLALGGSVDIAIIKVDTDKPLPALTFGDSSKLQIGDPVLTIGNPLGLGMSVSAGIVSAVNRNINDSPYDDFIQTDAAINHGNSGGPLINSHGEVVGIDTSLYTGPHGGSIGLGFAITSNDAKFIIDRLRTYGEVRAGWIGVTLQDVSQDVIASFDLKQDGGAIVAKVDANSSAAAAGIRAGDIIRTMEGERFADARALMRLIGMTEIGKTVALGVWRNGQDIAVPVRVTGYPSDGPKETMHMTGAASAQIADAPDLGLATAPISPATRARYALTPQETGVVVSHVTNNTAAMAHGINPGDVVLRVDDTPVATPAAYLGEVQKARAAGRRYVLLLVRGNQEQRWVGLPIGGGETD